MQTKDIREKYLTFFEARGHKRIKPAPIVPVDDPTTLFTGSGMQQLVPYLKGEAHPEGKRLVDSQPCFRAEDIEEVGDNRHTTFFEMLGNWSLGNYFKEDQLKWFWEFLTEELKLEKNRLHATLFEGSGEILKDEESYNIWKELGLDDDHIHWYGADKNWWSRAGVPENMPAGEIGGPDSEVFYDFGEELGMHEKSEWKDEKCHVNCDCGRYLEIGNSVFIQYEKQADGSFKPLPNKNVDFGGGLERLAQAVQNKPDMFEIDMFQPIIAEIEKNTGQKYKGKSKEPMRVIADHLRAATFMIAEGVKPSNKKQGHILRRLLRRSVVRTQTIGGDTEKVFFASIPIVIKEYSNIGLISSNSETAIMEVVSEELGRFAATLSAGNKEIKKTYKTHKRIRKVSARARIIPRAVDISLKELAGLQETTNFISKNPFLKNVSLLITKLGVIDTFLIEEQSQKYHELVDLAVEAGLRPSVLLEDRHGEVIKPTDLQLKKMQKLIRYFEENPLTLNSKWTFRFVSSYGLPVEILRDLSNNIGIQIDTSKLEDETKHHKEKSRTASAGMFKGGLADNSEKVTRLHTATHLLHQSLRTVLGDEVTQSGSNITGERLRFDYTFSRKPTEDELKKIEDLMNEKIQENLPVHKTIEDKDKALSSGALAFFREKYDDQVSVYTIGKDPEKNWFSKELCGGPHVNSTGDIGGVTIKKEENSGAGKRRIYVVLKK